MRIDLYGMTFDGPGVTYYLWSPWRCSALEHRLFDVVKSLPNAELEQLPDELRVHLTDAKVYKASVQATERVLKGWQEEASDAGGDRRAWRWMVEGDADAHGYDHAGEKASIWAFLRLSLERGAPADGERGEDIDLNGFGFRVWRAEEAA
ncbi:MAG TPA: hypothetical protein VM597_34310 [Gemmataceae bacterium]|jgi:hypothetical protein|nr:hypothetical protein [Gemmataceae bacterium]